MLAISWNMFACIGAPFYYKDNISTKLINVCPLIMYVVVIMDIISSLLTKGTTIKPWRGASILIAINAALESKYPACVNHMTTGDGDIKLEGLSIWLADWKMLRNVSSTMAVKFARYLFKCHRRTSLSWWFPQMLWNFRWLIFKLMQWLMAMSSFVRLPSDENHLTIMLASQHRFR